MSNVYRRMASEPGRARQNRALSTRLSYWGDSALGPGMRP